jgi:hypothetical protein
MESSADSYFVTSLARSEPMVASLVDTVHNLAVRIRGSSKPRTICSVTNELHGVPMHTDVQLHGVPLAR